MWNRLAIEEENIMYISKPYLTEEEGKFVPRLAIFDEQSKLTQSLSKLVFSSHLARIP